MNATDNDRELQRLMKGIDLEKPGAGFSTRVMDAVLAEAAKKQAYRTEPILGLKFWIFVGLFIALAAALFLLGGSESTSSVELNPGILEKFPAPDLTPVKSGLSNLWKAVSGLPITLAAITTATTLLILADKYFSSKQSLHFG